MNAGSFLGETDEVCKWSELGTMVSNLNAVALLGKVFSLLQHFSTFSPRMFCSVAYWQSYGGGAGTRKQATFLNVGEPQ